MKDFIHRRRSDLRRLGFQRTLSHINQTLHPKIQFGYRDALDELGSLYPRTSLRLASNPRSPAIHVRGPVHIWLELGFVLIFATMIAYFLNLKALLYISPFVESVYIYLLPITGAIVSISLGLQKFSWHDPIALVLIIAGFALINKRKK